MIKFFRHQSLDAFFYAGKKKSLNRSKPIALKEKMRTKVVFW